MYMTFLPVFNIFLNHINSKHVNIKFTVQTEQNSLINFLDRSYFSLCCACFPNYGFSYPDFNSIASSKFLLWFISKLGYGVAIWYVLYEASRLLHTVSGRINLTNIADCFLNLHSRNFYCQSFISICVG